MSDCEVAGAWPADCESEEAETWVACAVAIGARESVCAGWPDVVVLPYGDVGGEERRFVE
jgi:hypothetical protein